MGVTAPEQMLGNMQLAADSRADVCASVAPMAWTALLLEDPKAAMPAAFAAFAAPASFVVQFVGASKPRRGP